ncbi:hypothetical protein NUW58_g5358 [Xylaria curta]|uniref:Uncharacterized protein n=1 Tax=Xylaria curta TaxID=42375 RepID=A0ACC1P4Y6_9PEZI|nr:hypothetical protein NUW58_g5358 [Xylaria curta]
MASLNLGLNLYPNPNPDLGLDLEVEVNGRDGYELKEALDAIQTRGEFATNHQYPQYATPGLEIDNTLIALPLDPGQVPLIRSASRQAPFGRGERTLVDTSVRDTWELNVSKFKITNPAWSAFLNDVLQHVSESLGISGVEAELYKLLLYEKGSFFKRHKDSEKAPGMIATLSICLPSSYKGGEVHLSHAGKRRVFDTSQNKFDLSALAWYADVTHEVKPIVEGHRLVLIYNIIQATGGATSADFFTQQDQRLHRAFASLNSHPPTPKRLLYFLDHKYSEASLKIDHLKGRDLAVGQALRAVSVRNGWYLFLCNVTKRALDDDDDYDHEEYFGDSPKLAMDTVVTCSGRDFASEVEINAKDILGPDPYSGRIADSESGDEFTGNEGASLKYRYHNSAAVIIPKGQLDQFFDYGIRIRVLVNVVLDDLKANPQDPVTRKALVELLPKAGDYTSRISSLVLTFAWRMKDDSLFRAAVRAAFKNGEPVAGIVDALVSIVKSAPAGPMDWDKSLGEFVASYRSLTKLSKDLDIVKSSLSPGDMQTSFQQWRPTIELLNFEGKQSLEVDDHDFILELTAHQWENVDWVHNTLLPKIRDCSDKQLLSKFICSMLQKGRKRVLDKAKDIATTLLESGVQRLYLGIIKFNSLAGDPEDWSEGSRFCQLLDDCLLSGLQQPVDELLRLSIETIQAAPGNDGSHVQGWDRSTVPHVPTLAEQMLRIMFQDFKKNKMPPNEPARDFVIAVLKKFVLADLPQCPQQLPGYSHQPRGCKQCVHCEQLDVFLVSPDQEKAEFHTGLDITPHLESRLPREFFWYTTRRVGYGRNTYCILEVTKLNREYWAALDEYKKNLRRVLDKVRPFRTEYVKALLGDSAYSELVALEQLPYSAELEPNSGGQPQAEQPQVEQPQVGQKRPTQEGIGPSTAKRSFIDLTLD